jgi:hypothetical protein
MIFIQKGRSPTNLDSNYKAYIILRKIIPETSGPAPFKKLQPVPVKIPEEDDTIQKIKNPSGKYPGAAS